MAEYGDAGQCPMEVEACFWQLQMLGRQAFTALQLAGQDPDFKVGLQG